jgi:AraC-like DNA-binding protein
MFRVEQPATTFPGAAISAARSELWLPRAGLAACVRAVMCRDTRGVALRDDQRYNHVPATPVCCIAWYFSGRSELLEPGYAADADSPRTPYGSMVFCGPFTRPSINWNPGPVHAMFLLLLPDALAALTGIDPGAYLDRVVPVEEVFDDAWLEMCRQVMAVADEERGVERIEAFLQPLWQQARPDQTLAGRIYADWSHSLALRAATSGWGRSLRQVERRIKQWTGQPLRELRGFSRSEQAFFEAVVAGKSGAVNWSEVAGNNGYADQSHFCRQARRITGFAPEELRRRIFTEESFWSYRLWGFSAGL